jgi:hypothetical protein
VVSAAVALAAAAMRWPDIQTQLRAISVCRTVAAAAGAPLNPVASQPGTSSAIAADGRLQVLLVPCIFKEAVVALATADAAHTVSELILLIRSIYMSCSGITPSPRSQLQQLAPSVNPYILDQVRVVRA